MPVERAAAQQSETVRLRIDFRLGGTLFDPFEVRQVEIRDPAGVILETIPMGSIVQDGVGLYRVDHAIAAAAEIDNHFDRWYSTQVSGATEKQFSLKFYVLPAMTGGAGSSPYLTAAESASYLPEDTALTTGEIAGLVALMQEQVEAVTGDIFQPVTMARVFDGNGEVYLPFDRPLAEITKLEYLDGASWSDVGIDNVRIKRSGRGIVLGNAVSYSRFPSRTRRFLDQTLGFGGCGAFPAGSMNVRITGVWGRWTEVPLQIKAAVGTLVKYAAQCDNPTGLGSNPYSGESIPNDRSFTLRQILRNVSVDNLTGYPDVDAILVRFRAVTARVVTVI